MFKVICPPKFDTEEYAIAHTNFSFRKTNLISEYQTHLQLTRTFSSLTNGLADGYSWSSSRMGTNWSSACVDAYQMKNRLALSSTLSAKGSMNFPIAKMQACRAALCAGVLISSPLRRPKKAIENKNAHSQ